MTNNIGGSLKKVFWIPVAYILFFSVLLLIVWPQLDRPAIIAVVSVLGGGLPVSFIFCVKMKINLIILALILIAFLNLNFSKKPNNTVISIGNVDSIENIIENLMKSTSENAFLIIKIHGTDDFIQFTGDAKGVQLDFPLITDRQKNLESAFRSAGKDLNLKIIENKGSDGSSFLDIDINGNASEITNIVKKFIGKLFNANPSTKLEFEYDI